MTTPEIAKKKSSTARQAGGIARRTQDKGRTADVIGNATGGIGLRHEGENVQDIQEGHHATPPSSLVYRTIKAPRSEGGGGPDLRSL